MNEQEDIGRDSELQSSTHATRWGPVKRPDDCTGGTHSESSGELGGWWADVRGDFSSLTFSTFRSTYIMTILMSGKNKLTHLKKKKVNTCFNLKGKHLKMVEKDITIVLTERKNRIKICK